MASITSAGSSLDVQSIVSQLMSVERMPLNAMDTKIRSTQTKISAFGTLKSKLSTLQTAARAMSTGLDVAKNSIKVTSSNTAAVDVSVTGVTAVTTHQVTVSALAAKHRIQTADFADPAAPLGMSSSIFVEIGSWAGTAFSPDAAKTGVTIDLTGKSLNDVASAINAAGGGVSARVEGLTGSKHLVVESVTEGTASAVRITRSAGPANEKGLVYDRLTGGMTETVAAANAALTVDGTAVTSQTNTVTTAVAGLSFNLKAISADPVTLSTTVDSSLLKTKLDAFISAYNDIAAYAKRVAPTGPDTAGDLKNDSSVSTIIRSLRTAVTQATGPAAAATLNRIGVRFEKDGTLSLNQAELDTAMATKYDAVAGLLSGSNGASASLMGSISSKIGTILNPNGVVGSRTDGLQKMLARQNAQRLKIAEKLPKIESRLLIQYSTLDAKLTGLSQKLSAVRSALGLNNNTSTN
jgi:flagellar hook-associated protein 2